LLKEEASRYSGDKETAVKSAALSRLVAAIDLRDHEASERAMEGVLALAGEAATGQMRQQIEDLLIAHEKAKKASYDEQKGEEERRERELLHQLHISGSAVGEINLETSEMLKALFEELYSRFDQQLQQLKERLLRDVA